MCGIEDGTLILLPTKSPKSRPADGVSRIAALLSDITPPSATDPIAMPNLALLVIWHQGQQGTQPSPR